VERRNEPSRESPSADQHYFGLCPIGRGAKKGGAKVKVKVRIQANNQAEAAKARTLLLKRCPELILANPRKGSNPKYAGQQKWACYGDFEFGAVRKRRS